MNPQVNQQYNIFIAYQKRVQQIGVYSFPPGMKIFRKQFPSFSNFFPFDQFNQVQRKCYEPIVRDSSNMVVSAPTSSGKTVIFELAIMNQIRGGRVKCLYLAPIKSLCHEKSEAWTRKFGSRLKIYELTSDTNMDEDSDDPLLNVDLVIATPEKIDSFSRRSLEFLSQIGLLLVDQVHMLNFEERGATLEAVVSRILSINNPRIIAVSATIPNIKQVAQWLKTTPNMTFLFGEEHRPVKINKVVLGFKSSNNPFTFQKVLNYKLLEVIRTYSEDKGVLVFCQTQKGTQMACQQIISDMREREFVDSDQTLLALMQGSKRVANTTLQIMLPQGIAFHNAGLALQDRNIVQRLFLDCKLRILCTTSTLAMGINLPARLVVIKSTQCYRGSGKGYQQYTQIEMDQMMGRAGRPPFDTEGTVVIMTQKHNYNKYVNSGKLETLQSHLYQQLTEHINAEISLKSIKNFKDVVRYFTNSFCYIRMKNSPASYGIKGDIQSHVDKVCLQSITKLDTYQLINYYPENSNIVPLQLGINVARNSIYIETIVKIVKQIAKIKSQRDYLALICDSEQIAKFRNKLDERKILKELNEKNKYHLKNAISTADKKAYVLIQCELDGRHIDNWQLRKQAKQMVYFMRRLTYCVKTACQDLKLFWPFYWSCVYNKYFTLRFWPRHEQMSIKQFPELNEKWKMLSAKGFKNIEHVLANLQYLDTICQKSSEFSQKIGDKIQNLRQSISLKVQKNSSSLLNNQQIEEQQFNYSRDTLIIINFTGRFNQSFRSITVVVGEGEGLYTVRTLKEENKSTTIAISSGKKYYLAIVKNGYIGFDEFYQVFNGRDIRQIENVSQFIDVESDDKINRAPKDKIKPKPADEEEEQQNKAVKNSRQSSLSKFKSLVQNNKPKEKISVRKAKSSQQLDVSSSKSESQTQQERTAKIRKTINNTAIKRSTLKLSRKKVPPLHSEQQEMTRPILNPGGYRRLNEYTCWKKGYPQFDERSESGQNERVKKLKIVEEKSSRSKQSLRPDSKTAQLLTNPINWQKYALDPHKVAVPSRRSIIFDSKNQTPTVAKKPEPVTPVFSSTPYDYFMNLFGNS